MGSCDPLVLLSQYYICVLTLQCIYCMVYYLCCSKSKYFTLGCSVCLSYIKYIRAYMYINVSLKLYCFGMYICVCMVCLSVCLSVCLCMCVCVCVYVCANTNAIIFTYVYSYVCLYSGYIITVTLTVRCTHFLMTLN